MGRNSFPRFAWVQTPLLLIPRGSDTEHLGVLWSLGVAAMKLRIRMEIPGEPKLGLSSFVTNKSKSERPPISRAGKNWNRIRNTRVNRALANFASLELEFCRSFHQVYRVIRPQKCPSASD